MARKRMIDPTIWADEDFGSLSADAMVMYMGMISNADDEGRLPGNALYLTSTIFPYRGFDEKKSNTLRNEILSKMKSVILYTVDEKEYLQFKNWLQYQSINKPSGSKYPPLPKDYRKATVALSPNRIEKNRKEEKGKETHIEYLEKLPVTDVDEFISKFSCNGNQVMEKALDLLNYCKAKGKTYSDYKAFLRNALKKDFGLRPVTQKFIPQEVAPDVSAEQRQKNRERIAQIKQTIKIKTL